MFRSFGQGGGVSSRRLRVRSAPSRLPAQPPESCRRTYVRHVPASETHGGVSEVRGQIRAASIRFVVPGHPCPHHQHQHLQQQQQLFLSLSSASSSASPPETSETFGATDTLLTRIPRPPPSLFAVRCSLFDKSPYVSLPIRRPACVVLSILPVCPAQSCWSASMSIIV
jgi:hypothetical protein